MRLRTQNLAPADAPPMRTAARRFSILAIVILAATVAAGCGRSAPEDAAADTSSSEEPTAAGVRVVSDAPVVDPAVTQPTVATTAPTTTMVQAGTTYVIEAGDTLSVIAEEFGVTVDALSEANDITDVNSIRPGQELIIPAG